jgi:hypothetical protein
MVTYFTPNREKFELSPKIKTLSSKTLILGAVPSQEYRRLKA